MLRALFKLIVIPPLSLFLLAGLGWLVRKRWPVLARWLIGTAVALLYVLSVPLVSAALARSLQRIPALDLHHLPAGPQAIVVLGADFSAMAPEYGGATVGMMTLERLRYAAVLHRATGLPVLTCGGPPREGLRPLAFHMAETLENDFATPVEWIESGSATTRENLRGAAELLNPRATGGVRQIYLVTHVWHLPRALLGRGRGLRRHAGRHRLPRLAPRQAGLALAVGARAARERLGGARVDRAALVPADPLNRTRVAPPHTIGRSTPRSRAQASASGYPASACRITPVPGSLVSTRSRASAASGVPSATVTWPACRL